MISDGAELAGGRKHKPGEMLREKFPVRSYEPQNVIKNEVFFRTKLLNFNAF